MTDVRLEAGTAELPTVEDTLALGERIGRQLRAGDVVWCPPGVKHWHGAAPTTALTAWSRQHGVRILRVHAVKENAQALRMMEAILGEGGTGGSPEKRL
mgnify:CR=1 FL=1